MKKIPLIISLLALISCSDDGPPPTQVEGYKPIYVPIVSNAEIRVTSATTPTTVSKNLISGNNIFQLEEGKGVHVMNIAADAAISATGFINIPGAHDLQINGQQLYTNIYNDLLVLDVSNLPQVTIVERLENAFSIQSIDVPPVGRYFECVDATKGIVIGWESATLFSPKCRF